jgi:hypothetical protein
LVYIPMSWSARGLDKACAARTIRPRGSADSP